MENNTTAVDWLIEQMKELDRNGFNLQVSKLNELGMQAREMERQQIEEAWEKNIEGHVLQSFEEYYNETYGKSE